MFDKNTKILNNIEFRFVINVVIVRIELDINLPKEGPLVYVVDTNILTGQGPIKVLSYDILDQSKSTCILDIGDELIYKNISVRYVQSDKNGDLIEMVEIN